MADKLVYMDHNATTPLHPEVKNAMAQCMDMFGNPSSLHSFGRHAREIVEDCREKVASFIKASPDELLFVGSGSEGNNTALSILSCYPNECLCNAKGCTDFVTTTIEHPCILETAKCMEMSGVPVSYVGVDQDGKVNIDQLEEIIKEKNGLVSVMMANNEIGTIQDIKKIASIVHEEGLLFHTDAVQGIGKVPIDVIDLDVDFMTISGHKMYGPKGIGVLYVKKGVPFCPLIRGGHQERGRRAGTENTIGIVGLAKAIEMRAYEMDEEWNRLAGFRTILKKGFESKIPDIQFIGHPTESIVGTLNVSFHGAEGEAILLYLDLEGIAVSTGSACASGSLDPSHVLLATGLPIEFSHGSIRISMGRSTTIDEIEYMIDVFPGVIQKIRNMSTLYKGRK